MKVVYIIVDIASYIVEDTIVGRFIINSLLVVLFFGFFMFTLLGGYPLGYPIRGWIFPINAGENTIVRVPLVPLASGVNVRTFQYTIENNRVSIGVDWERLDRIVYRKGKRGGRNVCINFQYVKINRQGHRETVGERQRIGCRNASGYRRFEYFHRNSSTKDLWISHTHTFRRRNYLIFD